MDEKRSWMRDSRRDPPNYMQKESTLVGDVNAIGTSTAAFRTLFACVSLHMTDRIRLLRFPASDTAQIQTIIQRSWTRGIQVVRPYGDSQEFKLKGRPWGTSHGDQHTDSRRLIRDILQGLFNMGWILKAAVDISKKEFDKGTGELQGQRLNNLTDSLLFRFQQPPPPPCTWLSISFDRGDTITIIDAPVELSQNIATMLGSKVQRHQPKGSVYEIKLRGYPWQASGTDTVQTRVILLILLECLENYGFSLYASIDQDNGPSGESGATEADVWFCNKQTDWTPGMPIYHS